MDQTTRVQRNSSNDIHRKIPMKVNTLEEGILEQTNMISMTSSQYFSPSIHKCIRNDVLSNFNFLGAHDTGDNI
jgi:hypothetical protein